MNGGRFVREQIDVRTTATMASIKLEFFWLADF